METLEKMEGLTVKLEQDEDAQNPRTDFDNFGKMVCFHRRYDLGDKHSFSDPQEFLNWWKANGKGGELIALGLLDHSGLHMYCGDGPHWTDSAGWDSGQVGWTYATADMIRKEYGGKRITRKVKELANKCLRQEIETYDQYLTGDVWGYVIEDEEGESIDSCWGFFGYEYAENEAKEMFKHFVEKAKAVREHTEGANIADNLTP